MATTYTDFVSGTLSAGIGNSDTTLASAGFADLPVLAGVDVAKIILDPFGEAGAPEVAYITTHTSASTSATNVLRGQDGTTARSHASGMLWIHAPVASDWEEVVTQAANVINNPGNTLSTGAPVAVVAGGTQVTGTSPAVSRADHRHALAAAAPGASAPGDTQSEGAATGVARADHRHAREAFASDLADVAAAESAGVATTVARGDHAHKIGTGAITDVAMFGGNLRGVRVATSGTLPSGVPVGTTVWATDKKRFYVLQSTGPDVWTYDLTKMPYVVMKREADVAATGLAGTATLNAFTVVENLGFTTSATGFTVPNNGLFELGAHAGFESVAGSSGMFRLYGVQVNNSNIDPQLTASGDAQGTSSSGFGYSPGSVSRPIRLSAGNTVRVVVRHNYTSAISVSCSLWCRQIGD